MRDARGYLMIIGAATLWGISATAAKFLLNHQISTILIVQVRVTVSAILLTLALAIFRPSILRIHIKDLWLFALLGIAGVAGANYTYYFTIKESTVATAILLQYTAPLVVMAYTTLAGEERFTVSKLLAAVLSLCGCFLAVGAYDTRVIRLSPVGFASGIGSMVCFAFLSIFTRHVLRRHNLWTTTVYSFICASIFWLIVNPPSAITGQSLSLATWGWLAALAIISVLIPHSLFFSGVRHVGASRAIIVSTFEPVVAIASAAVVLSELLQPIQVIGAVLVVAAIFILQFKPEDATPAYETANDDHGTQ